MLHLEGGGAAGGMGAGLYAFLRRASCGQGIEIVTDALHLADIVADADLVITGEGRIDSQTVHGKVPVGVARVAQNATTCRSSAIAGSLTADVGDRASARPGCGIQRDLFRLHPGASTGKCRRKRAYDGEKRRRRAENGPQAIIRFFPGRVMRRPGRYAFYMDALTGAGQSGEEDLHAQHFACFPRDVVHFIQQLQKLRLHLFGGGAARVAGSQGCDTAFSAAVRRYSYSCREAYE